MDHAVVSPEEVEDLARKLGLRLYRTCVKENINVTEVFVYLAELHQRKLAAGQLGAQQQQQQQQQEAGQPAQAGYNNPEPQPDRNNNTFGVDEDGQRQEHARTVDLAPSKRRTKGKKSFKDK